MAVIDYIPYLRKSIGHDLCLAVGLGAIVLDKDNRILLEKRRDNGLLCLPGGALDLNETVMDGLRREIREETGILLHEASLYRILSGEKCNLTYPNGDTTQYVEMYFVSKLIDEVTISPEDDESAEIFFADTEDLPSQDKWLRNHYAIVRDYLDGRRELIID